MKVVDGGTAANVEGILACAFVAGARSLDGAEAGERVLDGGPLAKVGAAVGRVQRGAKIDQECFFGMDRDAATCALGGGALVAQDARTADRRGEASGA